MNAVDRAIRDISPDFTPDDRDAKIMLQLVAHEATPRAVTLFAEKCRRMTDYGYWFALGTLWVSYTGWSDLELWKRLFRSTRPRRDTSLMKPSEWRAFQALPDPIIAYRAHRKDEADWISYTLDPEKAGMFALQRGVDRIVEYAIPKPAALCLFLRRGEFEVLALDRTQATRRREVAVVVKGEAT